MAEEQQQEPREEYPQGSDLFDFGCEVAWRMCGCEGKGLKTFELRFYKMPKFLADLAAGKLVLENSPADFRAWRESFLKRHKRGELPFDFDPELLERHDPEKGFREVTAWNQRLARLVLESWTANRGPGDTAGSDD